MKARAVKMQANNFPGLFAKKPNRPSICNLGKSIISDVLMPKMVEYRLFAAVELAFTSKGFDFIFKQALVNKLLQLMSEASRLNPSTNARFTKIYKLIKRRPGLMFGIGDVLTRYNGERLTTTPIEYAYQLCDGYVQEILLHRIKKIRRLQQFVTTASSAFECVADKIDPKLQIYHKYLTLSHPKETLEDQEAFIDGMTEDEYENHCEKLDEYVRTKIGTAQADLPRWLLDDIYNNYNAVNENDYAIPSLNGYLAVKDNAGDDSEFSVAESLNSTTYKLGSHFAIFLNNGRVQALDYDIDPELVLKQYQDIQALYNCRIELQKSNFMDLKIELISAVVEKAEYSHCLQGIMRTAETLTGEEKLSCYYDAYTKLINKQNKLSNAKSMAKEVLDYGHKVEDMIDKIIELDELIEKNNDSIKTVMKTLKNLESEQQVASVRLSR